MRPCMWTIADAALRAAIKSKLAVCEGGGGKRGSRALGWAQGSEPFPPYTLRNTVFSILKQVQPRTDTGAQALG